MESRPVFCMFFDDIRHEVGGKTSYMGQYRGDLILNVPLPVTLPKLCMSISVMCDITDLPSSIVIRVNIPPDGHELLRADITEQIKNSRPDLGDSTKMTYMFNLEASPITLASVGSLEVFVDTERETARAGRLRIKTTAEDGASAAPNASSPPSEQSPPDTSG